MRAPSDPVWTGDAARGRAQRRAHPRLKGSTTGGDRLPWRHAQRQPIELSMSRMQTGGVSSRRVNEIVRDNPGVDVPAFDHPQRARRRTSPGATPRTRLNARRNAVSV